jgi:hypothetical protein
MRPTLLCRKRREIKNLGGELKKKGLNGPKKNFAFVR